MKLGFAFVAYVELAYVKPTQSRREDTFNHLVIPPKEPEVITWLATPTLFELSVIAFVLIPPAFKMLCVFISIL